MLYGSGCGKKTRFYLIQQASVKGTYTDCDRSVSSFPCSFDKGAIAIIKQATQQKLGE